jgi:Spy/CpxP family protein refolding chaperone
MKQSLIFVVAGMTLLFSTLALAKPSAEQMLAMKHANPMPNLMMMVIMQPETLDLNDEQKNALKAWRKQAQPKMMEMVKTVIKLEKQLHEAALAGAPGSVIQEITSQMLNVRGAIIKNKLACRNHMVQVIGVEKMKKLIELYKAKG